MLIYNGDLTGWCENNVQLIEIIPDKKNSNTYFVESKTIFDEYTNFTNSKGVYFYRFGEYFQVDSDRRLYIGSNTGSSSYNPNSIIVSEICLHSQYYSVANKTCYSNQNNFVTFDIQDTTPVACNVADIANDYNEAVVNSIWTYSWNDTLVGVNWETWNDYMARRGISAGPYYTYTYNTATKGCANTSDTQYCSRHSFCLDCFKTNGCAYANNAWDKGSTYTSFSYDDSAGKCQTSSIHNTTNCGNSNFNIDKDE